MKATRQMRISGMPAEQYQADPALGSTTIARARRSWAHALAPFETTPAMEFGSGFHALVGEPVLFAQKYAKLPECDRRTKEGKQIYADFVAANAGKTILTSDQWTQLDGMLKSLLSHSLALELLTGGVAEESYFWADPDTGVAVKCRPDYLLLGKDIIVDIKTAEDASQPAFQRTLLQYGRHIQTALYLDGVSTVEGRQFTQFVHLVIEKKPAKDGLHPIAIYSLDDESIAQGRSEYKKLLKEYAMCQKIEEWPAYAPNIQTISLPNWGFIYA